MDSQNQKFYGLGKSKFHFTAPVCLEQPSHSPPKSRRYMINNWQMK